jgi:hypothetical protein
MQEDDPTRTESEQLVRVVVRWYGTRTEWEAREVNLPLIASLWLDGDGTWSNGTEKKKRKGLDQAGRNRDVAKCKCGRYQHLPRTGPCWSLAGSLGRTDCRGAPTLSAHQIKPKREGTEVDWD